MCLYTTQVKPKVFTKDRVFYKVLYKRNDECGIPYYNTPYTGDSAQIDKVIRAKGKGKLIPKSATATGTTNLIFDGYIHLLRIKSNAEELKAWIESRMLPYETIPPDEVIVVRAKVKSGTEYYSGFDGNYYDSVAVKKVKYELI